MINPERLGEFWQSNMPNVIRTNAAVGTAYCKNVVCIINVKKGLLL
jgi:hypothetical protein